MNNAAGISGAAGGWGATRGILWMPYRITSTADNVTAVSWMVNNGACVISQAALYPQQPQILEDAFANALANNVLPFAAAGNDNNWYATNMWPAYFNSVMAVGGIDQFGRHWAWDDSSGSCYGDWVELTAPADAQWTCDSLGYAGGYGGTSWATPRAAAIAAMVVNYRNIRGTDLRDVMLRTSDYVNYLSEDCNSFGAEPYVHNKVNAYEAVMVRDKNVSVNWIATSSDLNPYANCYNQYLNFDARDTLYGRHSHGLVPNVTVRPRAMVQNRGKFSVNFNVTATSTGYTSTRLVTGLESGKGQIIEFDPFTPGTASSYTITVYTSLVGDQNTRNDTFAVNFACSRIDTVQTDGGDFTVTYGDAWLAWAVAFTPERLCTLRAVQVWLSDSGGGTASACSLIIWNRVAGKPGTRLYAERFTAAALTDGKMWRTLTLSTAQVIEEPVFIGIRNRGGSGTVHTRPAVDERWDSGTFWISMSGGASGATDWDPLGEDLMLRPIVHYATVYTNDVAAITIDNPGARMPVGFAKTPKATVRNVGTATNSFPVTCSLYQGTTGVYANTRTVTNLAPNTSTQVTFDPYTFSAVATYTMKVYTNLTGDAYRRNDTLIQPITVTATDELTSGEGAAAYYWSTYYFATRFTPQAACTVIAMKYLIYRVNTTSTLPCSAFVWNNTNDNPGSVLWGPTPFSGTYYPTWHQVDIPAGSRPYIPLGSSFFGGLWSRGQAGVAPGYISVLSDNGSKFTGRSRFSTNRVTWGTTSYNFFIHAIVRYVTPPATDIGVISIDAPEDVVKPNYTYIPRATIKNSGNSTVTGPSPNFTVRCMIDTANAPSYLYDVTVQPSTMLPEETRELSFGTGWTPTVLGKYYRIKIKKTSVPADNHTANDSLIDSVYCSNLDLISYNTGPRFFFGSQGDTSYCAQRFTPELPCSLLGYWIALYDSVPNWNRQCTTFVWNNRGDGREWPRAQQLTPWYEAWTPTPSDPSWRSVWFRRTISPPIYYNMNEDFWIGFKDPPMLPGQPASRFPVMWLDYWLDYGRSFWDVNRDSTWWYPLSGDWCLEAIVKYIGGEPKILRGKVVTSISAGDTTLHFRAYRAKDPERVWGDINCAGASISQIRADTALWQIDCRYFPWSWNDRVFTIIDYETNSGTTGHTGYYAVIIDTLLRGVSPQDAPDCILRPIPKPRWYTTYWWGPTRKVANLHWAPPAKDIGRPDTTYVIGYDVYRSSDGINFIYWRSKSGGINDTTISDTAYPPYANRYYAIKLCYQGHSFGKGPATIKSRYLSEHVLVNYIGIEEEQALNPLPTVFALNAPKPNPAVKQAVIRYAVPMTSDVKILLYDVTGRLVATLVNDRLNPGFYEIRIDNKELASGIYFCRMKASEFDEVKKLILVQ